MLKRGSIESHIQRIQHEESILRLWGIDPQVGVRWSPSYATSEVCDKILALGEPEGVSRCRFCKKIKPLEDFIKPFRCRRCKKRHTGKPNRKPVSRLS